jgi:internalin A
MSENHITQLEPIECLTNLQDLSLAFNDKIEDITCLSKLCKLQSLNLRVNLIQHLEPLSNLVELRKLDLSINQIVDISPLWKLKELKELSLYANYKLQFVGQLSGLTQLTVINISQCDIRSPKYIERLQQNLPQCQIIHDEF